jgi:hypothetical protein
MFSYYGAKTKIVDIYPAPTYDHIVEPFAGSARYALKYWEHEVTLYETYPKVLAIWRYLKEATEQDILGLPDVKIGDDIRTFESLSPAERWLMGYQLQRGNARPGCLVNARCRWNVDKIRIASEVHKVKHWTIQGRSGMDDHWGGATYFVDPPYEVQKHGYTNRSVSYGDIRTKVETGEGQFIVCGNADDHWAPFEPLATMRGISKSHVECMWYRDTPRPQFDSYCQKVHNELFQLK